MCPRNPWKQCADGSTRAALGGWRRSPRARLYWRPCSSADERYRVQGLQAARKSESSTGQEGAFAGGFVMGQCRLGAVPVMRVSVNLRCERALCLLFSTSRKPFSMGNAGLFTYFITCTVRKVRTACASPSNRTRSGTGKYGRYMVWVDDPSSL